MDALKESDQLDNTLIVFFGDHGYHLGEHDWWNKFTLFELATGAPFIVVDPTTGTKGVKSEAMIEFVDIYPTLAERFQLNNTPDYLEGRSFSNLLKDPSKPFRNAVQAVMTRGDLLGKSVKNKKWRYIEWDGGKQGIELYTSTRSPQRRAPRRRSSSTRRDRRAIRGLSRPMAGVAKASTSRLRTAT